MNDRHTHTHTHTDTHTYTHWQSNKQYKISLIHDKMLAIIKRYDSLIF